MDMHVNSYTNGDPVLARRRGDLSQLRRLQGAGRWTGHARQQRPRRCCSRSFRLQQELNVPVGVMVGAVAARPGIIIDELVAATPRVRTGEGVQDL